MKSEMIGRFPYCLKVGQCEHVCIGKEGLPDIGPAMAVRSSATCLTSQVHFPRLDGVGQTGCDE